MEATEVMVSDRQLEANRLQGELATLSAHINAATARFLELARAFVAQGTLVDDAARWLAFRCGMTTREAREHLRVAEALQELPGIRAAFSRGELTFTKVRSLVRVATPGSEEGLLELAAVLTASQLERALRAFRRLSVEEAGDSHELEYVDYYFDADGSLYLRARLAAEDGTLFVRALEAARERVRERRREERAAADLGGEAARTFEPPRSPNVEAIVELVSSALASSEHGVPERARLVVHVDVAAVTADGHGRSELEAGPVISPETVRRLGCDAETVTLIERDGLPVSVGRARRTVPPTLRRLLEARRDLLPLARVREPPPPPRPPPNALGPGRRDEPRQPRPPLLAPRPARARGRIHDRGRSRRRTALPQPLRRPLPEHSAPAAAGVP
jgi:Domain of unknown function (DUF222)